MALPGLPWSPEFMAAYSDAMNGDTNPKPEIGASRTTPGTFDALIVAFYSSQIFRGWGPATQRARRNILEKFRAETMPGAHLNNGWCRVAHLLPRHVDALIAAKMDTPSAAKVFHKTLKILMRFAIKQGFRKDDPTEGTSGPRIKTDGHATWAEQHIEAFQAAHTVGTKARLAMSLLLFTGQRRGDIVRMGRQHVREGAIHVRQQKTGIELEIPIHSDLRVVLDATPSANMTFLTTESGKPFSPAGFGNVFREWCDTAGIPRGYTAHGLRKAACRRLAEAGCTANQIASISGHTSLAEVQRYTKAADQVRMARIAMATVSETFPTSKTRTQTGKPK